jgi:hypothetical protein
MRQQRERLPRALLFDGTSCGEVLAPRQKRAPRVGRVSTGRLLDLVQRASEFAVERAPPSVEEQPYGPALASCGGERTGAALGCGLRFVRASSKSAGRLPELHPEDHATGSATADSRITSPADDDHSSRRCPMWLLIAGWISAALVFSTFS